MMNPWDRERMWRESEPGTQSRGFASGMMWLVAIILGIFGMIAMAKSRGSAPPVAVIPVAISLFFIFMFMIGHRREQRRLAATRWQNAQNAMTQQVQEVRLDTQALAGDAQPVHCVRDGRGGHGQEFFDDRFSHWSSYSWCVRIMPRHDE